MLERTFVGDSGMWKQVLLFGVFCAANQAVAVGQQATSLPSRTNAGEKQQDLKQTKQETVELLRDLSDASNPHWLIGQNAGHGNWNLRAGYHRYVTGLETFTDDFPSLLGIDLGYNEIPSRTSTAVQIVREFKDLPAGKNGIVAVSMHPPSPFRNSDCNDVRPANWDDLYVPGYIVQKRWQRTLDRVADTLLELQEAGVVVLWRPFHEMNGGWFWWCARRSDDSWTSQEEFIALWKHMQRHFEKRGIENLLWVYSPAVQTDAGQRPADFYYPGDDVVDVVALDWYSDDLNDLNKYRSYEQLVQLGKPMGLGEFGPSSVRNGRFDNVALARAMQRYPHLGFAMYWQSWEGANMAIKDQKNADVLFGSKNVLTLRKLDLYRSRGTPSR